MNRIARSRSYTVPVGTQSIKRTALQDTSQTSVRGVTASHSVVSLESECSDSWVIRMLKLEELTFFHDVLHPSS